VRLQPLGHLSGALQGIVLILTVLRGGGELSRHFIRGVLFSLNF
jgi:hypothetical protein